MGSLLKSSEFYCISFLPTGKLKRSYGKVGFITKEEDYRRAIVTLVSIEQSITPSR
jgi:hypothetical protein